MAYCVRIFATSILTFVFILRYFIAHSSTEEMDYRCIVSVAIAQNHCRTTKQSYQIQLETMYEIVSRIRLGSTVHEKFDNFQIRPICVVCSVASFCANNYHTSTELKIILSNFDSCRLVLFSSS